MPVVVTMIGVLVSEYEVEGESRMQRTRAVVIRRVMRA